MLGILFHYNQSACQTRTVSSAIIANPKARPACFPNLPYAMFSHAGRLWRPAQDCTRDYGSAMTLARIDRLDGTGYVQTAAVRWRAPDNSNILGAHTWNSGAGLEVIDLFASRRKLGL